MNLDTYHWLINRYEWEGGSVKDNNTHLERTVQANISKETIKDQAVQKGATDISKVLEPAIKNSELKLDVKSHPLIALFIGKQYPIGINTVLLNSNDHQPTQSHQKSRVPIQFLTTPSQFPPPIYLNSQQLSPKDCFQWDLTSVLLQMDTNNYYALAMRVRVIDRLIGEGKWNKLSVRDQKMTTMNSQGGRDEKKTLNSEERVSNQASMANMNNTLFLKQLDLIKYRLMDEMSFINDLLKGQRGKVFQLWGYKQHLIRLWVQNVKATKEIKQKNSIEQSTQSVNKQMQQSASKSELETDRMRLQLYESQLIYLNRVIMPIDPRNYHLWRYRLYLAEAFSAIHSQYQSIRAILLESHSQINHSNHKIEQKQQPKQSMQFNNSHSIHPFLQLNDQQLSKSIGYHVSLWSYYASLSSVGTQYWTEQLQNDIVTVWVPWLTQKSINKQQQRKQTVTLPHQQQCLNECKYNHILSILRNCKQQATITHYSTIIKLIEKIIINYSSNQIQKSNKNIDLVAFLRFGIQILLDFLHGTILSQRKQDQKQILTKTIQLLIMLDPIRSQYYSFIMASQKL